MSSGMPAPPLSQGTLSPPGPRASRPGVGPRVAAGLLVLAWIWLAWGGGSAQAAPAGQEPTPTTELSPEFVAAYERLWAREVGPPGPEPGPEPSREAPLPALSTWMAALLAVGGLAYGGLWGWRRLRPGRGRGRSPGRWIWVREEQRLGAAQRLVLAQVGETALLLGVTEQQITLLARFDAQALESQDPEGFAARLDQALASGPAGPFAFSGPAEPNVHERVEDLRALRQEPGGRTPFSEIPSEVTGHA